MSAVENKAVFLSYASQDAEAARRICEALRAAGVEVWFDQSELVGGDAWDAKIRKQIKECALFVPVISANTQARREGYFRIEWRLAAQRTHAMSDDTAFLLPVVIDDTRDAEARVPAEFKAVQWTRIPGSEAPQKFCERVSRLLGGEVAPASSWPAPDAGKTPALPPLAGRRVPTAVWIAATAAALAVVAFVVWPNHNPPQADLNTGAGMRPRTAERPAAPVTEAQKLVAQARQVYEDGDELNRENLMLSEDLVKRALEKDSAEPSAWELAGWLSYFMVWQQFDNSEARRETLRRQSARALALAPQSVSAHVLALNTRMAGIWVTSGLAQQLDLQEIERELQLLAKHDPTNWQIQRSLGMVSRFLNRPDDSVAALRRAVDLSGGDSSATADLANVLERRKRLDEFEAVVTAGVAVKRTGRLLAQDVFAKARWRGDLAAARAAIEKWPAWLLQEDRGLFAAWQTFFWSRQPDKAVALVRRMPRDYLRDAWFAGPRAVLTARAHEMSGHREAAEAEWRTVVHVADRELALKTDDPAALYWKAWALARLGETARAQTLCTLLLQQTQDARSSFFKGTNLAPLLLAVGLSEPALADVQTQLTTFNDNNALTRAMLELEPAYDPLRTDARFQALLATAPAPAKLSPTPPPSADSKSVAVLAFENKSDDPANELFSDGLSEDLIGALGRVPGLTVTGWTSSLVLKKKNLPTVEIGKQLGVAYVVRGSVWKSGDTVRITAQVSRAATDVLVWSSAPLNREVKDSFKVRDEIADLIAQALTLKLGVTSATATTKVGINPEAYRLYLEGREAWRQRDLVSNSRAELLFQRALELEPNFARALSGLADVWSNRAQQQNFIGAFKQRQSAELQRIGSAVARVLELDPDLAEGHRSLAVLRWLEWKTTEGIAAVQQALKLNPNDASAHQMLGRLLMLDGRMEGALAALKRSHELDPLFSRVADNYSVGLLSAGRHEQALALAEHALELQPGSAQACRFKVVALAELGRAAECRAAAARYFATGIDSSPEFVAYAFARIGDRDEARRLLASFSNTQREPARSATLLALGSRSECLAGIDAGNFTAQTLEVLLYWPIFDQVRDDPVMQQLFSTLGLNDAEARARAWRAANRPHRSKL